MTIYTIGHADREWSDFVAFLRQNNVELLADIRTHPGSRHCPQFNQEAMIDALSAEGIRYVHIPELGGRRKTSPESRNTSWRHPSFRGYADYMETPPFQTGVDKLIDLAQVQAVAYMCSETVWWKCHRSMVSDYLVSTGWDVQHILGDNDVKPHHYTEPARIVDGKLTYRPAYEQLEIDAR